MTEPLDELRLDAVTKIAAIQFYGGPDALGRRSFALFWHDGERSRAQHFFAQPKFYIARLRRFGIRVVPAKLPARRRR